MDNHFGGVIWTNHALDRLRERGISQSDAWATWSRPDQSRQGSNQKGSWVYYKTYGDQRIEVVAKKNPLTSSGQAGEWIILSVWSRPVLHKQAKAQGNGKSILRRIFEFLFVKSENRK